jgi:alpha-beta hydrolase superfamily lysophospholipase
MPLGQGSFEAYRRDVEEFLRDKRKFLNQDESQELAFNSPREWRPEGKAGKAGKPGKGILLVHGLGDSPFSFSDVGPELARRGFLVRAILLPGCGSNPGDLIGVSVEDWRRVVSEQAGILAGEVGELYLGGFSNGANLALEYAMDHPEVKGLLLFSPAMVPDTSLDFLAPLAAVFSDWILRPGPGQPDKFPHRYAVVPTNAFAQYYYASVSVRRRLRDTPYARPVAMVVSERDSVLDVPETLRLFEESFTSPESRLIYYGDKPLGDVGRAFVRPGKVPGYRVSSFSHMGVLFSPENGEYGVDAKSRICQNGQTSEVQRRCLAGGEVWYSAWGHRVEGKDHARLTFNPYFDWQMETIAGVLSPGRK